MKKIFLSLVFWFGFASLSYGLIYPNSKTKEIERQLKTDARIELIRDALESSLIKAARILSNHGEKEQAAMIIDQWERVYSDYFTLAAKDLGDHAPLALWILDVYRFLQDTLGDELMQFYHLDDIYIFAYAIPVVFQPTNPEWDQAEYKLHFVPLAGATTYWVVYAGCSGYAMHYGVLAPCSLVGEGSEAFMVYFIAPPLSDFVYEQANQL